MQTNYSIALRLVLSKKRAMIMSLSGIVFGVGLFVLTQAQTEGFEHFFVRTILGTDGAIRIEDQLQDTMGSMERANADGSVSKVKSLQKHIIGVKNPYQIKQQLYEYPEVAGVSEILRGTVDMITTRDEKSTQLYGINLEEHLAVSNLEEIIKYGDINDFRRQKKGLLIGSVLAERNYLQVGDTLSLRKGDKAEQFRVAAIFESGVDHIDKKRIYGHMIEARAVLREPHLVTFLQVNVFDPENAPKYERKYEEVFDHVVTPWQERERTWLEVFKALRVSSALTVSTIILISGLGMFNTLAIIVMEKQKEIAILRSMGYTRKDISHIFLWQGFLVLSAGAIGGCLFAALATWGVTKIPLSIRGIFSTDHFIVHWSHWHYIYALVSAGIIVMIASYFPARKAARLEPGDIIRGTGG